MGWDERGEGAFIMGKMNQEHAPIFRLLSLAGKVRLQEQLDRLTAAATGFNDWPALAAIAEEQGMAPLFYAHCRATGVQIPIDVRRQLQALTVRHQLANQIQTHALGEILQACSAEGIEAIVLGEAALAWTVYPSAGLRPIHSLELLTPLAKAEKMARLLVALQYHHPEPSTGLPGISESRRIFWKKQAGLRIMVKVQSPLGDVSGAAPGAIERTTPFQLKDIPACCLSPEEMLRHAYQKMLSTDIRIIHFSDLISVAEQFVAEIDWQRLRTNHPGLLAALTLLDGVVRIDEVLVRAAQLKITSPLIEAEGEFFSRLESFTSEAMADRDGSSLMKWGQLLAGRLMCPEARQVLLTLQHRPPIVRRQPDVDPGVQAVLDSKLASWKLSGMASEISAPGTIPLNRRPTGDSGKSIPRIIHQTWKDTSIPEDLVRYRQTWKQHHPDWTFILWTDRANRELIRQCYSWFLPFYDGYLESIMRADAARYFILHHFGGVYVDLDFEAFRPLDPLLAGKELVFGLEPPEHLLLPLATERDLVKIVCNAFMASLPKHPFWRHVFQKLVEYSNNTKPLDATGPFLLTRACTEYKELGRISLVPSPLLYPICNTVIFRSLSLVQQKQIQEEAYAIHHWRGGWWRKDEPSTGAVNTGELRVNGTTVRRFSPALDTSVALFDNGADLPLISGMMVTKDRPQLAERAIHCFLRQTYPAKELVIIDDGENDRLEKWVRCLNDPRVRFFRLPSARKTLGELRNLALERVCGEYVAQWDDDDLSDPQRLEFQMAAILLYQVDACLLQRQMIWYPCRQRLAVSNVRHWESSFVCRRTNVPPYPLLCRGEDTPVIDQITTGRYLWLDCPHLYIYTFHGRNTFDSDHFDQFWRAASLCFEGDAYRTRLAELGRRLGIDMTAPDTGVPAAGPAEADTAGGVQGMSTESIKAWTQQKISNTKEQPGEMIAAKVLILLPVKDAVRFLPLCLHNLHRLTFPHSLISLGFLESDSQDQTYSWLVEALPALQKEFRRTTLVKRDYGYRLEGCRWATEKQRRRREILARSRNYLLSRALRDEDWVLWLDVDVARYPADVIETLLACGKEIAVPNCLTTHGEQYDLNTYKLKSEAAEIDWRPHIIDDLLQPPAGLGRWYLKDLSLFDAVEVDAVGGTMLLIKADLHRDGLIFPPFPFRHAIETEGLAAMANDMGYRCWGLPKLVIHHPA